MYSVRSFLARRTLIHTTGMENALIRFSALDVFVGFAHPWLERGTAEIPIWNVSSLSRLVKRAHVVICTGDFARDCRQQYLSAKTHRFERQHSVVRARSRRQAVYQCTSLTVKFIPLLSQMIK